MPCRLSRFTRGASAWPGICVGCSLGRTASGGTPQNWRQLGLGAQLELAHALAADAELLAERRQRGRPLRACAAP